MLWSFMHLHLSEFDTIWHDWSFPPSSNSSLACLLRYGPSGILLPLQPALSPRRLAVSVAFHLLHCPANGALPSILEPKHTQNPPCPHSVQMAIGVTLSPCLLTPS